MIGLQAPPKDSIFFYCWIVLFAVLLGVFYFVFRRHGLEIQIDSPFYIRGALNLKDGLGYTYANTPITHFPIGLSYIYYLLMLVFPASIYTIALYLNVALLACVGILFKRILQELTLSEPIQFIGFIIFFLSPPILHIGSKILSELPSVFLILIGLLLLFRNYNAWNWKDSLLLGVVLGLGILIRFAMVGILAGFVCALIWTNRQSLKQAVLLGLGTCIPSFVFMATYSYYISWRYNSSSVDRELLWHPISAQQSLKFISTPFSWIIQYQLLSTNERLAVGVVILLLIIVLWKSSKIPSSAIKRTMNQNSLMMMFIISLVYCLFIVISISYFDASTPVDTRILSLIAVFFYIVLAVGFHYFLQYSRNKKRSLALIFLLGLFISWPATKELWGYYKYPRCFNKPSWQKDARAVVNETAFQWIKPGCTLYSNSIYFWQLCNNKKISRLPKLKFGFEQKTNPNFIEEMKAIRNDIAHNKAQLIFFYDMPPHYNNVKKSFIDTFFNNAAQFNHIPFHRGIIIEAK